MAGTARDRGGWLAFELSVLNRLKFKSVAIPFSSRPELGSYLKRSGVRVLSNDPLQSAYAACVARIENDDVELSPEEVAIVLEDAYVPQYELRNPALRKWFGEADAWWFDNVRANIDRLQTTFAMSIALETGIKVGNYALSFDDETRRLRQPFSKVFERLLRLEDAPRSNGEENICRCTDPSDFTAETYTDLYFLRLPGQRNSSLAESMGGSAWAEVWVRGHDSFWDDLEKRGQGRLGSHAETRSQYLEMLGNALETAGHIPLWAIEHVEDGFIHSQEIVDTIAEIRKVDTVFTKDFSELTGQKAVIITAGSS